MAIVIQLSRIAYTFLHMENDLEMVDHNKLGDDGELRLCQTKNMNVIEDMGRINHIFCDKTGTLTKNELVFK
jgi:magnesium-transporting ATPase (P-type)